MSKTTIPTGGLADAAISTAKIADDAVTAAKATGIGITEADMWRYTADTTGDAEPITSNLERVDTVFDKIGTGMSESSGIFSFPSTGIYEVSFGIYSYVDGENRDLSAGIEATTDNSSYTVYARSVSSQFHATTNNTSANAIALMMFDVTNITTHKVRFKIAFVNNDAHLYGSTSENLTWMRFIKLGDT
jgi:hypothetical protein